MKFSASFVVLAFALAKSTVALPLDLDNMDIVERDYEGYDLEARDYSNLYEERSFEDDELYARGLYDDLEERELETRAKKPSTPAPAPAPPADNKKPPADNKKPPADDKKPPADNKKPPADNKKPPADNKKPTDKKKCKTLTSKRGSYSGGGSTTPKKKTRSLYGRDTTGKTITVGGKSYTLEDEVSGQGGDVTFKASGGTYAKRPKAKGAAPKGFADEVTHTEAASKALGNGLFVASSEGTATSYAWLITKGASGGEIWFRWVKDTTKFATKKACEDDMTAARTAIKAQLEKMVPSGFVHGDNHPGNWLVNESGAISTANPIDFGMTKPATTNIDDMLKQQYKYNAEMWETLKCYDVCK